MFTAAAKMTGKAGFSGGGRWTGRPLRVSSRCLASGLQPAGQMDTSYSPHSGQDNSFCSLQSVPIKELKDLFRMQS